MPNETETSRTYTCYNCDTSNLTVRMMCENDAFENNSGIEICAHCRDDSNEFRYSDRRECFVHVDDWDSDEHDWEEESYDEDDQRDENVDNYTARVDRHNIFKLPYEKLKRDTLTIGVELEVQLRQGNDIDRNEVAEIIKNDFDGFVICKEDSSIGYGFEIVSHPATFDYHKFAWERFFSNSSKYVKSYGSNSTGLHIHISRKSISQLGTGKILYFINSDINKTFLDKISGRTATDYCYRNNNLKIVNIKNYRDRGAFCPFVHHSPTHEFRLFKGNTKKESFYRTLEFVVSLTRYAQSECSTINPNYRDYIQYVRSVHYLYPYLSNWLVSKNYIKNIKPKTRFYKKVEKLCV